MKRALVFFSVFSFFVICAPAHGGNEQPAGKCVGPSMKAPKKDEAKRSERQVMQERAGAQFVNDLGMAFVWIPAGTFLMGSPENEPQRHPNETQHLVTLTKGFYIQTTEVTQDQWKKIMGDNPSRFKECGVNCPVERVSWNEVQTFIHKLNQMDESRTYRLPTEAEWEYACRSGTNTPFSSKRCLRSEEANFNGKAPAPTCPKGTYRRTTVPVASFPPNAWGLYDMEGNVWEWCEDWYGKYPSEPVTDPKGPSTGTDRVNRGGGWPSQARNCRAANRYWNYPEYWDNSVGFRLVCDLTSS